MLTDTFSFIFRHFQAEMVKQMEDEVNKQKSLFSGQPSKASDAQTPQKKWSALKHIRTYAYLICT